MSLDRKNDASPVRSVADLLALWRRAEKPAGSFRVGVEHERIGILVGTTDPVPHEGPRSTAELLRRFGRFGYELFLDTGEVIAAEKPDHALSLEPGGQFELSGRPQQCAWEIGDELLRHGARARAIGHELGIRWLPLGYRPFGTPADAQWVPKTRYRIMRAYLPSKGRLALDMMTMTATVQASYDFSSEEDMAEKVRMAMSVSPIVSAMFASSFLVNGRDSGMATYRYAVWNEVDPDRCGLLPFVFEEGFGYERYAEWALDVPMFFVRRGGDYLPARNLTFRRYLAEGLGEHRATVADWEDHLSTLFPEVRVKNVIEVRGADAGQDPMNTALPALWRGLFYDAGACHAAWELLAGLSFEERLSLQREVAIKAPRGRSRQGEGLGLARELVAIAGEGLRRLPCSHGDDGDRAALEPLAEVVASGNAPADIWRARWDGDLQRDPRRFIEAIAE